MKFLLILSGILLAGLSVSATDAEPELLSRTKRSISMDVNYIGCFEDQSTRALSGSSYSDGSGMTVESCISYCRGLGYSYAGVQYSSHCFCGDDSYSVYGQRPSTECNGPCTGNNAQDCGGTWRNSVYAVYNYIGCFKDQSNRALSGSSYSNGSKMTVESCISYCSGLGYSYAGVQYSSYCFCGDNGYSVYGARPEGDCSATCTGNSQEYCGGTWRNSVYAVFNYKGCYVDQSSRALTGSSQSENSMTIGSCIIRCRGLGYRYAGLQYSSHCFCGNDDYSVYGLKPSSECNGHCSGNNGQYCGGTWRNSIYAVFPDSYKGCYVDQSERALSGTSYSDDNGMTVEACIDYCRDEGYSYAGVQYSSYCFCGDNEYSKYGTGGNCNAQCTGNNKEYCGGTWRNSVYAVFNYIGCFEDQSERALSGSFYSNNLMNIKSCIDYCDGLGYAYAGLQYSSYCFCGDDNFSVYGQKDEADCSASCSGNNEQYCGGTWRNAVYSVQ